MPDATTPSSRPVDDIAAAVALLAPRFVGLKHEELHVAHLDHANCLLRLTAIAGDGPDSITLPLRALVAEALAIDAQALVIAHNHPGGDPAPTIADRRTTRRLAEVVTPLGIHLFDHLIFAGEQWISFRALGLL